MNQPSPEERWAEYEKLGPEKVRQNIASRRYGPRQREVAREWLDHIESLRSNTSSLEQNRIARSAKNAAWAAAIAAIIAAIAAIVAILISLGWKPWA